MSRLGGGGYRVAGGLALLLGVISAGAPVRGQAQEPGAREPGAQGPERAALLLDAGAAALRRPLRRRLTELGFEVVEDVVAGPDAPRGAPCREAECAARIMTTTGAAVVVTSGLVMHGERPLAVWVVALRGDVAASADAPVRLDVEATAREALDGALARLRAAQEGVVTVEGPPGLPVAIDGATLGRAPRRLLLPAGRYRLRLGAREAQVDVAAGAVTRIPARAAVRGRAHPASYVLGAGLLLAATLALIPPLVTWAREGQCANAADPCLSRVRFGPRSATLVGVGAVLVGAGVTVTAWAPIRGMASIGPAAP
ncbi:MAG: hypothetical protein ACFCGT_08500 [Sandaracinaceae bacterium]